MKRIKFVSAILTILIVSMLAVGCKPAAVVEEWKWEPGNDAVAYTSPAADEWSPTFTIFLRIVGGDDTVLYDGSVTLTSPQMMAAEFLSAAITDKGLAQEGIDIGFITRLGDYENDSTENVYWMFYVNGEMPNWGVGEYRLRDGDYVKLAYEKFEY